MRWSECTSSRVGVRTVIVAMASAVWATSAAAQVLPPVPTELDRLEWMVGEWEGGGWTTQGPAGRSEFRGTETVERRMGGRLVVVEGAFTAWMGPELGDRPVHQALGIFSYDPAADRLAFRTYTAAGGGGETSAEIREDGAIVWGFEDPRTGRVRYTITRTPADEWHEIGERSNDGESWTKFFEMTLSRRPLNPARTP